MTLQLGGLYEPYCFWGVPDYIPAESVASQHDCFDRFEALVGREEWLVVPLWHPQYLHHSFRIRALAEQRDLLGGRDQATLIVSKHAAPRISPQALTELTDLRLGNQTAIEMEFMIYKEGLSALEAADRWLAKHGSAVST